MDSEGTQFWQLTNVEEKTSGVLHPHFSHKGDRLFWSQMISKKRGNKFGEWVLKLADFKMNNKTPKLVNIKTFKPGKQHLFYESHGFTTDDKQIIFSGNLEPEQDETGMDLYLMEIETGELTRLTETLEVWDELADISPDGKQTVWSSSQGYTVNPKHPGNVLTDLWLMNINGSDQRRLTYFNELQAPEYLGGVVAADKSWGPDGKNVMLYLITDGRKQEGVILLVELY